MLALHLSFFEVPPHAKVLQLVPCSSALELQLYVAAHFTDVFVRRVVGGICVFFPFSLLSCKTNFWGVANILFQ